MYKAQADAQGGGDAQPGHDASQNGDAEGSDVEDVDFEEVK
jgi:molecular chaperone DnaK